MGLGSLLLAFLWFVQLELFSDLLSSFNTSITVKQFLDGAGWDTTWLALSLSDLLDLKSGSKSSLEERLSENPFLLSDLL